jgi:hypothetical protein
MDKVKYAQAKKNLDEKEQAFIELQDELNDTRNQDATFKAKYDKAKSEMYAALEEFKKVVESDL